MTNETPPAERSWGFSLGWKQFVKQAEKELRVGLGAMLLHITAFSRVHRICVYVRFNPERAV
jgi:hypothetical protein